jgi:hypothetical protein
MNFSSKLIGFIKALRPSDVASYLSTAGWRVIHTSEVFEIFQLQIEEETFEVTLPDKRSVADYTSRMQELISNLSIVENRSADEIVNDIINLKSDIIRIRKEGYDTRDGTIPLSEGVIMVKKAYDMLYAAACSAVNPKSVYASKKFERAAEYMNSVRLGQTEKGSFIVTAHSPIQEVQATVTNDALEQFPRKVITTFAKAMDALQRVSTTALESGDVEIFEEVVSEGVSANLCEAIVGIQSEDVSADVSIKITWSPNFEAPTEIQDSFVFNAQQIPILKRAAEHFREKNPLEEFSLHGIIVKLNRDGDGPGTIYIRADNDECKNRMVKIVLSAEDYHSAVHAHDNRDIVEVSGTLKKEGRYLELINYSNFINRVVIPNSNEESEDPVN